MSHQETQNIFLLKKDEGLLKAKTSLAKPKQVFSFVRIMWGFDAFLIHPMQIAKYLKQKFP